MRLVIFISFLCLIGCSTKPTRIAYDCPTIQLPDDPVAATETLTDESDAADVIKAWVATAYAYRGWNVAVRKQVESSQK
jgi:hypothetical protein